MTFVAVPELERDLGMSTSTALLLLFTLPGAVASLAEPPLLLWADRHPRLRRRLVTGGLALMGAGLGLAAIAPTPWALGLAMTLMFIGNGLGVNLAQATLMDLWPARREQLMTRWVLMGTLGDVCAPLLLAVIALLGGGWRVALGCVAGMCMVHALWLASRPFEAPTDAVAHPRGEPLDEARHGEGDGGHDDDLSMIDVLRMGLRNRALLPWLCAVAMCGLLDEVFVAVASVWLEQAYHASLAQRGFVLGLATFGGVLGLVVLDRALARGVDPRRWLTFTAAASGVGLVVWLAAPTLAWSAAGLFLLEALVAQLYPLVQAQAFRAHDRAVVVEALQGLFAPIDFLLPLAIGFVADRVGVVSALLLLGLQTVGIVVIARRRALAPGP
ncbi:MAG: MFS transporter [Sandaracinaceae bacterium]|nr:MFS transporter [Sandaracinaceae bacterium]